MNYWLALLTLLVLVVGAYWPSMRGDFLWDDDYYVTNNKALNHPDGIEQIWMGIKNPKTYPVPQYYPMTHTSFWVQTRGHDWSEPLQSWSFHLVNVLLHFGSAWMLWTILRRLGMPGAFVAAAIWALHPLQVESVAWITERKNVLSAFFMFASMIVYMRFSGLDFQEGAPRASFALPAEKGKLYALALVLFACAVLSKSVTGVMPAVVLLLIWWKRDPRKQAHAKALQPATADGAAADPATPTLDYQAPGTDSARPKWSITWQDILPLIPFFVLAIAMGAITSYFEKHVVGAQGEDWNLTIIQRFLVAGGAVWFYADKLIFPWKLTFIYPRWDLHTPLLVVALGALVAFVGWLWFARERIGRGPITIALLFIGTLFPALGFVNYFPMRYSFVADHFQYISGAVLIAGAVWVLHRFFTTAARFTVASALILGAFTAMTFAQNRVYTSLWTLWGDTVQKNPSAWIAWHNLANLERDTPGMLSKAEEDYRKSLELRPGLPQALMNLGIVQEKRGDLDGAIDYLKQAAAEAEKDPLHSTSYALIYYNLGDVYHKKGDLKTAYWAYRTAAELSPRYLDAINAAGSMLSELGDRKHAQAWFDRDVDIDPQFLPAHANLGNLYLQEGDLAKAQEEYGTVIAADRTNIIAINGMGLISAQLGNWDAAILLFKRALEINPNFEDAQKNLMLAIRHKQEAATRPATTQATTAPVTMR
jgi:tetratricopeptide (TPR) repeat protein